MCVMVWLGAVGRSRFVSVWSNLVEHGEAV